ncbi:MAG: DUF4397 domain-containing protein [Gemmatimonadaceae bacterium]|nr:DUF4397 domain-containing protein [Gemmatimonadaceae bacterium]
MRSILRLTVASMVAGATLTACRPDTVITTEDLPTAGVRFINASPDTSGAFGVDFRFLDLVESNAQFRHTFRSGPTTSGGVTGSTLVQYKAARAGARSYAVFLDDTIQTIASTKVFSGTANLTAGTNYTYIMWGQGRTGTLKLGSWDETTTVPSGKVAIRVINATESPIDVRYFTTGGTEPTDPSWAAVPGLSKSNYINVDPASITFSVRAAGGTTNLFNNLLALPGTAASSSAGAGGKLDISSTPGTTVAGSAISLIVFPRSTAGARTPQAAAFLVPAGTFVWDVRPPRGF